MHSYCWYCVKLHLLVFFVNDEMVGYVLYSCVGSWRCVWEFFFFQAEDGIRDLVRSRGLGDVYKRQQKYYFLFTGLIAFIFFLTTIAPSVIQIDTGELAACLLYTSDAADERSSVDLGGRRFIKKKNQKHS